MTKYRGYYVDGVVFHNKKEIDIFVKQSIIDKIKLFNEMFLSDRYTPMQKMQIASEIAIRERRLHDEFGMDWTAIESIA